MKLQKHTLEYLHKRQVSQNLIEQVEQLESAEMLDEAGFEQAIREKLGALSEQHKKPIKDGARVSAYQAQAEAPVVKLLVCDDAGRSTQLRHFKIGNHTISSSYDIFSHYIIVTKRFLNY